MLRRVEQAIREEGLDRARLADRAGAHDLARAAPLRMMTNHERFGDELARPRPRRDERLGLGGAQRNRLLAQHMLARLQRADGPLDVQLVGQRIVDRLDRRVCEQLLIGAVGFATPSLAAAALARLRSREAIASMRATSPRCIAGSTWLRPIWATLSTPQDTLRDIGPSLSSFAPHHSDFLARRNRPYACRLTSGRPIVGAGKFWSTAGRGRDHGSG